MSIKVIFYSNLSRITGRERMELDHPYQDVRSLIEGLVEMFPAIRGELYDKQGTLDYEYQILLNGKSINSLGGLETPLRKGDELAFLMPLSGGLSRNTS